MNEEPVTPLAPTVVGPNLLGFNPELSPEDHEDILYATGFAYDTTLKAHLEGKPAVPDAQWKPNLEDPLAYHRNQLRYLGWDVGKIGALPALRAGEAMYESILRDVDQVGVPGSTGAVAEALEALKRHGEGNAVFEQHAYEGTGLSFQIMANTRISHSRLAVLLYRRRYQVRERVSRFLFTSFDDNFTEVSSQFEVVNFNLAAYRQTKRDIVAARMKSISAGVLVRLSCR